MSPIDPRRATPAVDVVLADPRLAEAARRLGTRLVHSVVTGVLDRVRAGSLAPADATDAAVAALPPTASRLRAVVNATGVLVHTNLGRAPLSAAAIDALVTAAGSTDVEYDLATGQRGRRGAAAIEALLSVVPEAEAAYVANNNAAALALVVLGLAAGREVILGRGEFVEIGDGFRIPELLEAAGARLREVGTTNRTRLADYASAVSAETAFILRIHPSNFSVSGFVSTVDIEVLAGLGPPVVYDIGSGLLHPEPLLPDEPDATTALRSGASLVTASGDKLLGGPQAGIVLGRAELVERIRRHPLARAMRVDKLTLAALEATVRGPASPVVEALRRSVDEVRSRVDAVADRLVAAGVDATAVPSEATVGGGGAPGVVLPSAAVSLPAGYAESLRHADPPVIGRVAHGRCLLDLRTVPSTLDEAVVAAVLRAGDGTPQDERDAAQG